MPFKPSASPRSPGGKTAVMMAGDMAMVIPAPNGLQGPRSARTPERGG
jgi:hypothetical protein